MITRIKLENFRRHAETEIIIGEGEQIIAVSGSNGSGKSTILEGIVFALFGQSRHGNRGLDGLIRDGAELEGMAVELDFTIGDDLYSVMRRRDGKAVSAVLSVNDIPLHTGTREVTAAVVNLLGTDAAGFKLAAVAQQKELDALIRLGPTERVKSISKLLRLDAVTRAKEEMGRRHSKFVTSMRALPTPADRAERAVEMAALEEAVAKAEAAQAAAASTVARLAESLQSTEAIEQTYREAQSKLHSAEGEVRAAKSAVAEAEAKLAAFVVPEDIEDGEDAKAASQRLLKVSNALSTAEQAESVRQDMEQTKEELERYYSEKAALVKSIGSQTKDSVAAASEKAESKLGRLTEELRQATEAAKEAGLLVGTLTAELAAAQKRRNAIEALGEECESCGQGISTDHKHHTANEANRQVEEASEALETGQTQQSAANIAVEELEKSVEEARQSTEDANSAVTLFFNQSGNLSDLERRISVYEGRLSRFQDAPTANVDELRAAKEVAEQALSEAEERQVLQVARAEAIAQQSHLSERVADAKKALQESEGNLSSAAIEPHVSESWENLRAAQRDYTEALREAGERAAAVETARGELSTLNATISQEESILGRLQEFQRDGASHALAKRLLTGLETKVGSGVVPTLQSAASEILDAMSNGRYSALKLDAKYTPSISDNGVWRPVQDLSGGEQDLVALALRLAVAELISARNSTGFGFLILDEVLGSQDGSRREAILSSLRALKKRYGQVWCISHVGGVEDAADRVIEIELDEDGTANVF